MALLGFRRVPTNPQEKPTAFLWVFLFVIFDIILNHVNIISIMDKEDKKQIVEMFEYISEKMATKEDLVKLETKMESGFTEIRGEMESGFTEIRGEMESGFKEVKDDIRSLRTDLETVEQTTESNKGFAKEIDTIFNEIKIVKDHVGLKTS